MRHIAACTNAVLPGDRMVLQVYGAMVGWVAPATVQAVGHYGQLGPSALDVAAPTLGQIARVLTEAGLARTRGEMFDVRADPDGPALAVIDRGALPALGIQAQGAHLNGLVRRPGGWHVWVGRRAADKKLDPGKLDHIVAGGVAAGDTPWTTLVKEAAEEAGIPGALIAQARPVGWLAYAMDRPEGLRRDRLHVYDLELPPDFQPTPQDGEVESFELLAIEDVLDRVRHTDGFKFNVNLVLIDLFVRHGLVTGEEEAAVRAAMPISPPPAAARPPIAPVGRP